VCCEDVCALESLAVAAVARMNNLLHHGGRGSAVEILFPASEWRCVFGLTLLLIYHYIVDPSNLSRDLQSSLDGPAWAIGEGRSRRRPMSS